MEKRRKFSAEKKTLNEITAEHELHLFLKKDDDESTDFYYIGSTFASKSLIH